MDANATKIARKFKLSAEDVAQLAKLGLDTPRKIKDAEPETLPSNILAKLKRWHPKQE